MADLDKIFDAILDIKESVTRTEEKVSGMSGFDDRIKSLEDSRSRVHGMMWTIGLAWAGLLAWIAGVGDWVHHIIGSVDVKN